MEYPSLDKPNAGAFRFNTDSSQLEIYDGNQWTGVLATSPNQQTGGTRGLFMGGDNGSTTNVIEFINISTTGSATDFGDLTEACSRGGGCASRTRGIRGGGRTPTTINTIDYVTIASTGNAIDFGDRTETQKLNFGLSDQTRGLFGGGYKPARSDVIDYITIASEGNAVDFGNMVTDTDRLCGAASPTRGIIGGGVTPADGVNTIQYVIISTLGNAADFGDLTKVKFQFSACANAVRCVFGGGRTPVSPDTGAPDDDMDYITIASLGNALDFGDWYHGNSTRSCSAASPTRGTWAGGGPSLTNIIDYIQIMTTGNTIDFGDLNTAVQNQMGCSNGHGGL